MDDHSKAIEAATWVLWGRLAPDKARGGLPPPEGYRLLARAVVHNYLRARAEGESPAKLCWVRHTGELRILPAPDAAPEPGGEAG